MQLILLDNSAKKWVNWITFNMSLEGYNLNKYFRKTGGFSSYKISTYLLQCLAYW